MSIDEISVFQRLSDLTVCRQAYAWSEVVCVSLRTHPSKTWKTFFRASQVYMQLVSVDSSSRALFALTLKYTLHTGWNSGNVYAESLLALLYGLRPFLSTRSPPSNPKRRLANVYVTRSARFPFSRRVSPWKLREQRLLALQCRELLVPKLQRFLSFQYIWVKRNERNKW